jgi:4-amino-4-deoxychorismate lyase
MLDCLVNGEISEHVPVTNRGLQYGDGVFETITFVNGSPRFWQLHMDRLSLGCEQLGMSAVPQALLLREVQTVVAGHDRCIAKIVLTRAESGRGYKPGKNETPTRIITAHRFPDHVEEKMQVGIAAQVCKMRLGVQPALAGIKHLNRLEQVLASAEITQPGIDEGILLDPEDHLVSGISSNIFIVLGDRLLTPRLDRCGVRGVMRSAILQAFRPVCEQRRMLLDMLPDAMEVFVCNSVRGVVPVTRVDHWQYEIGPRTREVQEWLSQQ